VSISINEDKTRGYRSVQEEVAIIIRWLGGFSSNPNIQQKITCHKCGSPDHIRHQQNNNTVIIYLDSEFFSSKHQSGHNKRLIEKTNDE
jgi:hypothetical protein